jgi:purine-binding chemotaxis protein CheW
MTTETKSRTVVSGERDTNERQLVTFTLGHEEYGVDISKVREINRLTEITHVPKAPTFVEGLINLRGTVVPIIDLRKRFGIEPAGEEKQQRIIVVDIGGRTIGVIVDSVSEVLNLAAEAIDEVPATISCGVNQRFLTGVGKIGNRLMLLLDLDSILSADELSTLKAIE